MRPDRGQGISVLTKAMFAGLVRAEGTTRASKRQCVLPGDHDADPHDPSDIVRQSRKVVKLSLLFEFLLHATEAAARTQVY